MNLAQLAERAVTLTGDMMLASANGAATQMGSALSEAVMGRLLVRPDSAQAALELRAAPGDARSRAEATAALREHLAGDTEFADELVRKLQQAEQHTRVETHGQGNTTTVGSTVTAHGWGTANAGIINKTRNTKKGGAFWGIVAAVIVVVGGGTTVLLTQGGQEESPEKQAEKVAVDFMSAVYRNDMDTVCGLSAQKVTSTSGDMSVCRDKEKMREAESAPLSEEQKDAADEWKVRSTELPSDSTARVTATNNGRGARVLLTREEGEWKVVNMQGGQG